MPRLRRDPDHGPRPLARRASAYADFMARSYGPWPDRSRFAGPAKIFKISRGARNLLSQKPDGFGSEKYFTCAVLNFPPFGGKFIFSPCRRKIKTVYVKHFYRQNPIGFDRDLPLRGRPMRKLIENQFAPNFQDSPRSGLVWKFQKARPCGPCPLKYLKDTKFRAFKNRMECGFCPIRCPKSRRLLGHQTI